MEKQKGTWKNFIVKFGMSILCALVLTACGSEEQTVTNSSEETTERYDTGFVVTNSTSYDSADTAILVRRDEKESTMTFLNLDLGKTYTLSVDGTTRFFDKYGEGISASQLEVGDIVDVTFLKDKKHLTTLTLSSSAWSYTSSEKYAINQVRSEVDIGGEIYKLTDNTQYVSDGKIIELMDLNEMDVLSFYGIDSQVLSVRVEKGHGYLRLANDENFVGGWIEVGSSIIQRITEDMCLTVPEGSYSVTFSNNGGGGVKEASIRRNEETTIDIGDLEIPEAQYGMVLFSVDPSDAEVYIDGMQVDTTTAVTLEYGLHQMIARADGYQTITQYIRVAQSSAGLDVVLEANDAEDDEESESSQSATSATDTTTTTSYKVYIETPENVEVYLDGNYIGISPCSFKKSSGSHTITLRKTGYVTRSYTVSIDEEEKDISYSFADLAVSSSSEASSSSSE